MGAHCHLVEPDGSVRLNRFGRPTVRTLLFPNEKATLLDTWNPIGMRGTASDCYTVTDLFVPEFHHRHARRIRACGARAPDSTPSRCRASTASASPPSPSASLGHAGRLHRAGDPKVPRGLIRLAENPLVQADVAHREAKLGAARAYLTGTLPMSVTTPTTSSRSAYRSGPRPARLRPRHQCRRRSRGLRLQGCRGGRDLPRHPVRAPLPRHPYPGQQIQSRDAHFEAVGRVLLGVPPPVFL